jgi:acyl phosphate:glycerol-3-phosphate acyltransferase
MNIWIIVVTFTIGYLSASIPSGVWIGWLMFRKDVRTLGSGGSGMTNVYRNFGKPAAVIVFTLDLLKSTLPVWIAGMLAYRWTAIGPIDTLIGQLAIMASGVGTSIGHCYPIFANFKGGKAVSSAGSFMLMTNWIIAWLGLATMILIIKTKKIVSIGSMVGFLAAVLMTLLLWLPGWGFIGMWNYAESGWLYTTTAFLLWVIMVYRHKENIHRLLTGQELDFKKKKR